MGIARRGQPRCAPRSGARWSSFDWNKYLINAARALSIVLSESHCFIRCTNERWTLRTISKSRTRHQPKQASQRKREIVSFNGRALEIAAASQTGKSSSTRDRRNCGSDPAAVGVHAGRSHGTQFRRLWLIDPQAAKRTIISEKNFHLSSGDLRHRCLRTLA